MTDTTAVHRALEHVVEEQARIVDRDAALETFARRVRAVPAAQPTSIQSRQAAMPTATATQAIQGRGPAPSTSADRCRTVRTAFDETVGSHSTGDCADESQVETMAAMLTEDIAVALATDAGWTPPLKAAVLEAVSTRRRELTVQAELFQQEQSTLEAAITEIDEIVDWLQATADESFLQHGFDSLQAKHEQLETYRDRLETRLSRRQAQLTGSTDRDGPSGRRYRSVVESIYVGGSAQYPLLSTMTRLYDVCTGCQRAVRAQLTRRV
ncbi:hypothetical protein [Natrinema sp. HArc-T2]|uniref:DUF7260 family protein n=1 Tax=Natrinema sp. HArc-T2 TaxID=3242701 RepID=UPI00359CC6FA